MRPEEVYEETVGRGEEAVRWAEGTVCAKALSREEVELVWRGQRVRRHRGCVWGLLGPQWTLNE